MTGFWFRVPLRHQHKLPNSIFTLRCLGNHFVTSWIELIHLYKHNQLEWITSHVYSWERSQTQRCWDTKFGLRECDFLTKIFSSTYYLFLFEANIFIRIEIHFVYRVFSHDVTAAMLVSQNKEMAAMLVPQTKPLGIELYFYANTFFCFSKPIWPVYVVTWMETLYRRDTL